MFIAIFLLIALPLVGFLLWLVLQDAFVKVDQGQIGLVITRGKPADRGIPPGMHFALRFGRVIEVYPAVEMAYLTTSSGTDVLQQPDNLTFIDKPMEATLGDRAVASVQYTVRFKVTTEGLPAIHTRFGPTGIGGAIRDESRRAITNALGDESVGIADAFGAGRVALEEKIRAQLEERLAECGFELGMFSLRLVDLGETGAVIQAILRAGEDLELELASAPVRLSRAQHEAEVAAAVGTSLTEPALEYLRLQVMRELVQRWDGKILGLPEGMLPRMGIAGEPPAPNADTQAASGN